MRKVILKFSLVILIMLLLVSCSKNNNGISTNEEKDIKETIDLVLTYDKGYDETVNKHINEENFYVCNYVEFYSLYIGELKLEEYESKILNLKKDDDFIKVYLILNIKAKSLEVHNDGQGSEEGSDEAVGENIPVEILLSIENGNYYIRSFTEYENVEKAKELNEGFR